MVYIPCKGIEIEKNLEKNRGNKKFYYRIICNQVNSFPFHAFDIETPYNINIIIASGCENTYCQMQFCLQSYIV